VIRITGGSARGRKIKGPQGYEFRPTTGRVKEFIFSVLRNEVEGAVFLDLFSGTGSFGIEAISRGAEKVIFIEKARSSLEILKNNLEVCSFYLQAEIVVGDVFRVLKSLDQNNISVDLIFADPPFKGMFRQKIAETVGKTEVLKKDGLLIIEHERRDMDNEKHNMKLFRQKLFGGSVVSFYSHGGEK